GGTGLKLGYIDIATLKFTLVSDPPCNYGISVDAKGRVWLGGWIGSNWCVSRYTPDAASPSTGTWAHLEGGPGQGRGIAVDNTGSVWLADTSFGVHQIDEEALTVKKDIPMGGTFVGMAVDFDDKIWAIDQGGGNGFKIDPASYAMTSVKVGNGPYTYSDMTGY